MARIDSEKILVEVRRRTLWVGDSAAYPLPQITAVRRHTLVPKREVAIKRFAERTGPVLGFTVAAFAVLAWLGSKVPFLAYLVLTGASAGLIAPAAVRLVKQLRLPRLYALLVHTAGGQNAFVVNEKESLVRQLMNQIVEAIDNPHATLSMTVENYYGDLVEGDKILGDKTVNKGWSD